MHENSFANVARNRIIITVLDEGDPKGKILRAQWKLVPATLTNVVLEVRLPICKAFLKHMCGNVI